MECPSVSWSRQLWMNWQRNESWTASRSTGSLFAELLLKHTYELHLSLFTDIEWLLAVCMWNASVFSRFDIITFTAPKLQHTHTHTHCYVWSSNDVMRSSDMDRFSEDAHCTHIRQSDDLLLWTVDLSYLGVTHVTNWIGDNDAFYSSWLYYFLLADFAVCMSINRYMQMSTCTAVAIAADTFAFVFVCSVLWHC